MASQLSVRIKELGGADGEPLVGWMSNASRSGICVHIPRALQANTCIQCEIVIPNLPVAFRTLMQVRWLRPSLDSTFDCGLLYMV
jgi:hypothetical protein